MSMPTNPPAAFYGAGRQRWYDGTQWTEHYQSAPTLPPVPAAFLTGPATAASLNVTRQVFYNRQQKGHSIIFHIFAAVFVLWISSLYYAVSPNHYYHL